MPTSKKRITAKSSNGSKGTIIAIGGREDREGELSILREVANRVNGGKLVVATLASTVPDEQYADYRTLFAKLGVKRIEQLDFKSREEAMDPKALARLDGAAAIFFSGGDQLKLTSKIAGTAVYQKIAELFEAGATIAGTSAGAAAMSETMLVGRSLGEMHTVASAFFTAAGLALLKDMIIDQHFAQRSRVGRLIAAVGEKPSALGIGIDEDTAIVVHGHESFEVIGAGAVYVVDGSGVTYTNISERNMQRTLAVFDVRLHVLKSGNQFDLRTRRPSSKAQVAATQ